MQQIEPGYMVFVRDGEVGVAGVREVRPDGTLVVHVENGGDYTLGREAVRAVHEGKVILDPDHLPAPMREALRHPHDAEYHQPEYHAQDPDEGALR